MRSIEYTYQTGAHGMSEPHKHSHRTLKEDERLLNLGPQHPSTHGVLRLEVLCEGEIIKDVVPHIGFLHRCFEKHAEQLPYGQIIPYVDRMDYVAAMCNEHAFAMGVERMLGITGQLPERMEYIRVMVVELNRIASHFIALGTYALDLGTATPFLWMMRDREHILRLLEWLTGARMLYNYIWIGALYFDLPPDFCKKTAQLITSIDKHLRESKMLLLQNPIFVARTANIGILLPNTALQYGVTGPCLRASGLRYDLRKVDGYAVYKNIDFDIPIGISSVGSIGDCWNRTFVRYQECQESLKIILQCIDKIETMPKDRTFDPHALLPKKVRPKAQSMYVRAENPRGELGFFFRSDGSDKPWRCKARAPSFANLSVLPKLCQNVPLADLIAILGSLDLLMGEIDR